MLFTDVIRRKRDGGRLGELELQMFVDGLVDQSIPPEQVSALAMAIFLNGVSRQELATLTHAMANSGAVLRWQSGEFDKPIVDKHSTGGVGDKVSFLLAPILAACGASVPMIAGRGLGHTGGTVDKLESIPGYETAVDFDAFRKVVATVGCAIIGQTEDLAPADRRLYAVRDVTGTVESVPLITTSILSKKLAAGLHSLVMDVKVGSGAFMKTREEAEELSRSIIETASVNELNVSALLTDMNEVLGDTAGNAVELNESIRYLRNDHRESRLDDVTVDLSAELLLLAGLESERSQARSHVIGAIESGRAAEVFARMVHSMGGPQDIVETFDRDLPIAKYKIPVVPAQSGHINSVDTRAIGNAVIALGGGRKKLGEILDLSVGLSSIRGIGDLVDKETPICVIECSSLDLGHVAEGMVRDAVVIGPQIAVEHPVVGRLDAGSVANSG